MRAGGLVSSPRDTPGIVAATVATLLILRKSRLVRRWGNRYSFVCIKCSVGNSVQFICILPAARLVVKALPVYSVTSGIDQSLLTSSPTIIDADFVIGRAKPTDPLPPLLPH